jgi:predicted ATP-dependent endonuclease of OLD family
MRKYIQSHGSEWNRWDLHVHTPASGLSNQFPKDWDEYVKALFKAAIENEIAVLGITDYFTIEGYKKLCEDYLSNEAKLKALFSDDEISQIKAITILPNIEFRLKTIVGKSRVNYHVIFSDQVSSVDIEENFLHELEFVSDAGPFEASNKRKLTHHNIEELGRLVKSQQTTFTESDFTVGCTTAAIDHNQITEVLSKHKDIFGGKYVIAVPVDEDLAKISWSGQDHMVRKAFYQEANLFFATNPNTIDFGLGRKHQTKEEYLNEFKTFKPCVIGSDAHELQSLCKMPNGNNCWIKAIPTFEGLKQILYEPEERVKIQQTKPDEKNLYQVIDSIELDEDEFWRGTIYLNPNLNSIIGGRSTGKSSLLKAIVAKHNPGAIDKDSYIHNHLNGVRVNWKDNSNEDGHQIEYYCQSYMHNIAKSKVDTDKLVEEILKSKDDNNAIETYESFASKNQRTISTLVLNIFQVKKECLDSIHKLKEKGTKSSVEQQLALLKNKYLELQKNSSMTPAEIEQYNGLVLQLEQKEKELSLAKHDIQVLSQISSNPISISFETENNFDDLAYGTNKSELHNKYVVFRQKHNEEWANIIRAFKNNMDELITRLQKDMDVIINSEAYKKGVQYQKDNKELQSIHQRIKEEEKALSEIAILDDKKAKLYGQVQALIDEISAKHCEYKSELEILINRLTVNYDQLCISVSRKFKVDEMKTFLEMRCNLRGASKQEYINKIIANYENDTVGIAKQFLRDLLNDKVELKNSYTPQGIANEFFSSNWYYQSYDLTYQNDSFDIMSEGKQAFVILKLLLEFSDKRCPILIDQPEDSLDNRAIYQELVEYIKNKKKERQIILVTHNSNVVVSADSENVIIANQEGVNSKNNDGLKFQYINGALEESKMHDDKSPYILESQGIREHVCDILEGGRAAFEKREKKYGFAH